MKRLAKAKSQEIVDTFDFEAEQRPVSPVQNPTGIMSKMKKVLGSYAPGSPSEKRNLRTQSLNTLHMGVTFGIAIDELLQKPVKTRKLSLQTPPTSSTPLTIPHIVSKIIKHVESNGLCQEGIYRVNGNARTMESLKIGFDRVGDADFANKDIFSVGGLLKLFLRQLPVSLVPERQIDKIVQIQESQYGSDNLLSKLTAVVNELPQSHYDLLKALCQHLLNVSQFSEENKMTPVSLSIVFGPSVMRCGGGLDGLMRQGNANAAFAKMIQHYPNIFEDEGAAFANTLSEQQLSSDESFGLRFKKVRKKPRRPEPFQTHMENKLKAKEETSPAVLNGNTNKPPNSDMDQAIDEAFEAVIREDLEAGMKKRKSDGWLATPITIGNKPKGLLANDDLTNRVASPYSWKSSNSPGTSQTTSPVVSPHTSQVLTALIGDAVQNNLFDTQKATMSFSSDSQDTVTMPSSRASVVPSPQQRLTPSPDPENENGTSIKSLEPQTTPTHSVVVRRSTTRGSRNRKSTVYGNKREDETENMTTGSRGGLVRQDANDINVQLLTVNDSDSNEVGGVTSRTGTVLSMAKQLSEELAQKTREGETEAAGEIKIDNDNNNNKSKPARPPPPMLVKIKKEKTITAPPIETNTPEVGVAPVTTPDDNSDDITGNHDNRSNDFDYISRTDGALFHPTLQRVRVPFKRTKPSRRSTILKKVQEARKEAAEQKMGGDTTTPNNEPSSEQTLKPNDNRNHKSSITSIGSLSSSSRLSPLPPEVTPNTTPTHNKPVQKNGEEDERSYHDDGGDTLDGSVAPEDKPKLSKAWPKNDNADKIASKTIQTSYVADLSTPTINSITHDTTVPIRNSPVMTTSTVATPIISTADINTMPYEDLLRQAQKLRATIQGFENDFATKHGRKPSTNEKSSLDELVTTLSAMKKKLKELRSKGAHQLSKTTPISLEKLTKIRSEELMDSLSSHSASNFEGGGSSETPRKSKSSTLTRHQSLLIHSTVTNAETVTSPLADMSEQILLVLSERRKKADRPEDLNLMTHEQLLEEKQILQRLLLNFERKYTRPQSKEDKEIMRPVYDRYREVKRQINEYGIKSRASSIAASDSLLTNLSIQDNSQESVNLHHTVPHSKLPTGPISGSNPSAYVLPLSSVKSRKQSTPLPHAHLGFSMPTSSFKSISLALPDSKIEAKAETVPDLSTQLSMVLARKKELGKELREFEQEFKEKYNRPLNREDKQPKYQQYIEYKKVKLRLLELNELVDDKSNLLSTT